MLESIAYGMMLLSSAASGGYLTRAPDIGSGVQNAGSCSAVIGRGGNLNVGKQVLLGKCEGNGQPVKVETGQAGGKTLSFSVKKGRVSKKDRAELAAVQSRLNFNKDEFVGFEILIPKNSDITNSWFYMVQFWQGANHSPIAGLRMSRGYSHRAQLMFRGEGDPKGTTATTINFEPGRWTKIGLALNFNPRGNSCMTIYMEGKSPYRKCGQAGYTGKGVKPWYRLKFGIYKGSEPDKSFNVKFRNIKTGTSLKEIWPVS